MKMTAYTLKALNEVKKIIDDEDKALKILEVLEEMGLDFEGEKKNKIQIQKETETESNETERDLEEIIVQELRRLGARVHVLGYRYLVVAIKKAIEEPEVLNSITKMLYPMLAKDFHTTASRMERAIRHSVDLMSEVRTERYLSFFEIYEKRPTNSEFIAVIANDIRLKMKN